MKIIIAAALATSASLMALTPAQAAEGCGRGAHRGPYGHCHLNRGLIVGNYYHGQGYWDGHRYWHHRMRDRDNHWMYR